MDVIFLQRAERARKPERGNESGGSAQERNSPSPVVCILCTSVIYSTHTDIRTVGKRWFDVLHDSLWVVFRSIFTENLARIVVEISLTWQHGRPK